MKIRSLLCLAAFLALAAGEPPVAAEVIKVQQMQGTARGFLVIRSPEGKVIGHGDVVQTSRHSHIASRITLRFRDGSLDDDQVVFSQDGVFRVLSDHHIQKGPFFPKPTDITVEAGGKITSRSLDKDGKDKVEVSQMDLPADLANGIVGLYLLNVPADTPPFTVSEVAPTGKGRLVQLQIAPDGRGTFTTAGVRRTATIFRIKVKIGGVAGVVAPVIGKEPADALIWVLEGESPTLVREVAQLYAGGPILSIELDGTSFPRDRASARSPHWGRRLALGLVLLFHVVLHGLFPIERRACIG